MENQDTSKIIKWVRETNPKDLPYGIVGFGWGPKIVDGVETGEYSVICSVTNKKPLSSLSLNEIIPKSFNINGINVVTDVKKAEVFDTLITDCYPNQPTLLNPAEPIATNRRKHRPLKGGCSSITTRGSDATLGILVRDKSDGQVVGLSNNHVYAGTQLVANYRSYNPYRTNNITQLSSIQPALSSYYYGQFVSERLPKDRNSGAINPYGSLDPYVDFIGMCKRGVLIGNLGTIDSSVVGADSYLEYPVTSCDAAIISLSSYDLITPDSANIIGFNGQAPFKFATDEEIDSLLNPSSPNFGSPVFRSGRTCGPIGFPGNTQSCSLSAYQFSDELVGSYSGYISVFEDCFRVRGNVIAGRGGDSGSAMFALLSSNIPSASAWKVIGLLFAGPSNNSFTLGCRITEIAKGMDIVSWDTTIPTLSSEKSVETLTDVFSNSVILSGRKYFQIGWEENKEWKLESINLGLSSNFEYGAELGTCMSKDGNTISINDRTGILVYKRNNNNQWISSNQNLENISTRNSSGNQNCFITLNGDGNVLAFNKTQIPYNNFTNTNVLSVYEYKNNLWSLKGNPIAGYFDGEPTISPGKLFLTEDGNTVLRAYSSSYGSVNRVEVFSYNQMTSSWFQKGQTLYSNEPYPTAFGGSVIINATGNFLAISDPFESTEETGYRTGTIRVYEYINQVWQQIGQTIKGSHLGSFTGGSSFFCNGLAFNKNGDILVTGTPSTSYKNQWDAGSITVYKFDGMNWNQYGETIYGRIPLIYLGQGVITNDEGDVICAITGTTGSFQNFRSIGVQVYAYENGNWNLKETIETGDSTDTPVGRGGFGIDESGDRILIGPSSLFKYGKPLIYSRRPLTPSPVAPFNINWVTTVNNPCDANPWAISENNTSVRYNITDSLDCGGTCDDIQAGTATANITVGSEKDVDMYLTFSGIGELEQSNFELISFSLDDNVLATGNAAGGGLGCEMGPIVQNIIIPGPYRLEKNTSHTFLIDFTTNDQFYHVGAYYQINLSFVEVS